MWNRTNGYHPDEETLEVDWPCHPPRSFHCKNCYALDARRETQAGSPQDHMATDSWEGNKGDGEDLGGHQVHGKGSPDVEGTRRCPTCLLGVEDMRERERERVLIAKEVESVMWYLGLIKITNEPNLIFRNPCFLLTKQSRVISLIRMKGFTNPLS